MLKTMHTLAAGAVLAIALTACGPAQLATTGLSPEIVAQLQKWCGYGKPILDLARTPVIAAASPRAAAIVAMVGPFCDAVSAGRVPATADANSINWLPTNLQGLSQALGVPFSAR